MKKPNAHRSSIFVYALGLIFSLSIWLFYFASVAYARDCPPNDPSRSDCAAAAQTAENPGIPAAGTITGAGTSVVINRRRRRPGPAMKPPREYGGRTNVWDPPIDEQQTKWEKEGLVWDPQTLSWRPPKPGEIPPPPDAPENPPPYQKEHPRDKVPVDCLELYDAYVKQQAKAIAMEEEIKFASEAQWDAQFKLNQLLAKFSLKFGYDLADTVILAKAVAELTVHLGAAMMKFLPRSLAEALETAQSVFRRASSKASDLAKELAEATGLAGRKAKVAEEIAESAKSLRGVADDAAKVLTEADEAAKAAQAAVKEAEEALAAATTKVDKLKAEKVLLEAQKAVVESEASLYKQWQDAYLQYMYKKPGAGIGGPLYDQAFKLEMLGHDIGNAKFAIANLRAIAKPSAAQLQELASLESKLAGFANEASSLKKIMDDGAKAFYGVDDVSKITNEFMEQHLNNHLRQAMGSDAFSKYSAASGEQLVGAVNKLTEIEGKIAGVGKELDPLMEASRKAGTKVGEVVKQAEKAQTAVNKIAPEVAEKASKAAEAESKAASASSQATEAQDAVTKTQTNVNAANQEVSTAETALKTVEAAANEHMKNHFAETPDEVAKVLISARDDVKRIVEALKQLNAERDQLMDDLRWLKPQLDNCITEHTPWQG